MSDLELHRRARDGDTEARNQIVAENMGLAYRFARRYVLQFPTVQPEIINNLAAEGLWQAVVRFDPDRGTRFSTYAYHWVHKQVTRGLAAELSWFGESPSYVTSPKSYAGKNRRGNAAALSGASLGRRADRRYSLESIPSKDDRKQADARLDVGFLPWHRLTPNERFAVETHFGLNGQPQQYLAVVGQNRGLHRSALYKHLETAISKFRQGHLVPVKASGGAA